MKKASQKVKTKKNWQCAIYNLHLCYNFSLLLHEKCSNFQPTRHVKFFSCILLTKKLWHWLHWEQQQSHTSFIIVYLFWCNISKDKKYSSIFSICDPHFRAIYHIEVSLLFSFSIKSKCITSWANFRETKTSNLRKINMSMCYFNKSFYTFLTDIPDFYLEFSYL